MVYTTYNYGDDWGMVNMTLFHPHEFILGRIIHTSPFSMDCFKGKLEPENPNKSHISWENQWFPVKMFPYNQSIALWVPIRCRLGYAGCPWAYRPSVLSCEWGSDPAWDQPGQKNGEKRCYLQSCPVPMALNYTMWGHVGPFAIAKLVRL